MFQRWGDILSLLLPGDHRITRQVCSFHHQQVIPTCTCNSDVQPPNQPIEYSDGISEQQTATTHTHQFDHCSHRYQRRPSSEPATAERRNCPWSNLHKLFRRAFKAHELVDLVHCNTNWQTNKTRGASFYLPLNPIPVLLPTYLDPRKGRRRHLYRHSLQLEECHSTHDPSPALPVGDNSRNSALRPATFTLP